MEVPTPPSPAPEHHLSILTDDRDRPLSVMSTTSQSPKITPAPHSPTRNLATEINTRQPFDHTITSISSRQTSNSSYPPSIEEDEPVRAQGNRRLSFVSGVSQDFANPWSKPTSKAPPPQHHTRSSTIERNISSPTAVSDSLGFSSAGASDILATSRRMASTKAVKAPRESTASTIESLADIEAGSDYQTALRLTEVDTISPNQETWPLRTPSGSPTPPRESVHDLAAMPKSPFVATDVATKSSSVILEAPHGDIKTTMSVRAPKVSRLGFLPRFLRSGGSREKDEGKEERPPAVPAKSPRRMEFGSGKVNQAGRSFFDDASTDEGEEEEAETEGGVYGYEIQDVRKAVVGRPVTVRYGSTADGSNIKVELKEMLRSTPPSESNPGPSKGKAAQILGEDVVKIMDHPAPKEGVYTPLSAQMAEKGEDRILETATPGNDNSGPLGLGLWKEINPFATSVLRSDQSLQQNNVSSAPAPPPKKGMPSPKPAPVSKGVSFPAPPPLDIRPEHRFLRQSIVSTPYPTRESVERARKRKEKAAIRGAGDGTEKGEEEHQAVLTLVLYSNSSPIPKLKTIVIPDPQPNPLIEPTENGKPPIVATINQVFDDEAFFKLLRSEYHGMRGSLRHLAGARNVRSLKIVAYSSTYQLASRSAEPVQFRGNVDVDKEIAEAGMLDQFRNPRLGRKRKEWTTWVRRLPENAEILGSNEAQKDRIAIEFVEGWAPCKLSCAVTAILFCSLSATLLWIFVARRGGELVLDDTDAPNLKDLVDGFNEPKSTFGVQVGQQPVEYSGARGRVQTGVELGMLILMFGWTGVGAWGVLSWLVM